MGYVTRSQGLPAFKIQDGGSFLACSANSNKTTQLFRDLYTMYIPAKGWKVFQNHLQKYIVIPSYFTTTELQNIYLFMRTDEVNAVASSWLRHETLWPSFTSTLLVFIIIILYAPSGFQKESAIRLNYANPWNFNSIYSKEFSDIGNFFLQE